MQYPILQVLHKWRASTTSCSLVAASIFGYQEGITEDALPYFDHFHEHVLYATPHGHHEATFRFLNENGVVERFRPADLALLEQRDSRFPLHLAISRGDMEATQRLVRGAPHIVSVDAIHCAFLHGRAAIVKYLLDARAKMPTHFKTLPSPTVTLERVQRRVLCAYDDVELVQLFEAFASPTWTRDSCALVLMHRRARVAEYLYQRHEASWSTLDVCTLASKHGLTGMLRLLATRGALTPRAIDVAIQYGRVEAVHYLRSECGQVASNGVWAKAATRGLVAILERLPLPEDKEVVAAAAQFAAANGHLDVLGFLTSRTIVSLSGAARAAVASHRADVLDFLLSQDPTVDVAFSSTNPVFLMCLLTAAKQGRRGILFERNAFTPTRAIVDAAASSGSVELVTWLCRMVPDVVTQTPSALMSAVSSGHVDVANVLLVHGLELDTNTEIVRFHISKMDEVLAFSTDHRVSIAVQCLHSACAKGCLDVVTRLLPRFPPATVASMVNVAFECNHPDVLRLLAERGATCTNEMLLRTLEGDAWASFRVLCDFCPVTDDVLARAVRLAIDDVALLQYVAYSLPSQPPSVAQRLVRDVVQSPTLHVQLVATLLPACMDPMQPVDNLKFFVDLVDAARRASNAVFRLLLSSIAVDLCGGAGTSLGDADSTRCVVVRGGKDE